MSLNRFPSHRSAQVPGHAKPAAALPPFKPASDDGRGKDEKPSVPWADLCLPTASLVAAGVLSLLCIPPLIRRLNPAPVSTHPSASAGDVSHLIPSIRRLDVSREHQSNFRSFAVRGRFLRIRLAQMLSRLSDGSRMQLNYMTGFKRSFGCSVCT
jgi:hypothetical protein